MTFEYLSPVGEAPTRASLAMPYAAKIDGSRLGFLDTGFQNADFFLRRIEELILERFRPASIVWQAKEDCRAPAPQAVIDTLAKECDLVISAWGH